MPCRRPNTAHAYWLMHGALSSQWSDSRQGCKRLLFSAESFAFQHIAVCITYEQIRQGQCGFCSSVEPVYIRQAGLVVHLCCSKCLIQPPVFAEGLVPQCVSEHCKLEHMAEYAYFCKFEAEGAAIDGVQKRDIAAPQMPAGIVAPTNTSRK